MDKQMSLSAFSDELSQVRTRKKEFLAQIDRLIPWDEWVARIKPCYYKGERGNKPFAPGQHRTIRRTHLACANICQIAQKSLGIRQDSLRIFAHFDEIFDGAICARELCGVALELMLRIFVLQNLYDLADEKTVAEVIDSRAFSEFCGVDSSNQVPNGDTLGRFRNLLIQNGIQKLLFTQVVELLERRGLILKKGTIVDSTIIEAPTSTKNKEKKRDPDAHQVKKGNAWHFGYKAHIGVDRDSGLVHTVKATAANVSDVSETANLLHGEEETCHGDAGYIGAEKRDDAIVRNNSGKKIKYKIMRRSGQIRKLSKSGQYQAKKREHKKSSIRVKVEHVFGVVKVLLKFKKTRYRGLRKQEAKFNIMFALANLILADRPSLAA